MAPEAHTLAVDQGLTALSFEPRGRYLATASGEAGLVALRDPASGALLRPLGELGCEVLALGWRGDVLMAVDLELTLHRLDLRAEAWEREALFEGGEPVQWPEGAPVAPRRRVAFDPTGRWLAVAAYPGPAFEDLGGWETVELFGLDGGSADATTLYPDSSNRIIWGRAVNTLSFSPDGRWLAAGLEVLPEGSSAGYGYPDFSARWAEIALFSTGDGRRWLGLEGDWALRGQDVLAPPVACLGVDELIVCSVIEELEHWQFGVLSEPLGDRFHDREHVRQLATVGEAELLAWSHDERWLAVVDLGWTLYHTAEEARRPMGPYEVKIGAVAPWSAEPAQVQWEVLAEALDRDVGRVALEFAPDDRRLVLGLEDGRLMFWEL